MSFVSEPITPVTSTASTEMMARGGPGLPFEFIWRGEILGIASVLRVWRETAPCRHGGSESYARKHWFEVETTKGQIARVYFERQPRDGQHTQRWWLFSLTDKAE